jgi:hypothetical protein
MREGRWVRGSEDEGINFPVQWGLLGIFPGGTAPCGCLKHKQEGEP